MLFTLAAVISAVGLAPNAAATVSSGGAPTPAGAPVAPPSATGAPAPDVPSAGTLSLLTATASPRKSYFDGVRNPSLRFEIGSTQPSNDIRIEIVDEEGVAVQSFFRNDVAPETTLAIRWDGTTAEGRPAPDGRYSFRIEPQVPAGQAARPAIPSSAAPLRLGFEIHGYEFPILGPHDFGGPADRFGAPRAGHTHQGQDTLAACGTPLVAARGGTIRYNGYESAAGNYLVIDGKGTQFDMVYMHMAEPSPLQEGEQVRTGQPIGFVGDTGDATACHLHFEMWTAPGWYQGGSPIDPLPYLKKWDAYS
jgi:murein DD-endopeptidase MepM/ murein hydrolase activator NlpD